MFIFCSGTGAQTRWPNIGFQQLLGNLEILKWSRMSTCFSLSHGISNITYPILPRGTDATFSNFKTTYSDNQKTLKLTLYQSLNVNDVGSKLIVLLDNY